MTATTDHSQATTAAPSAISDARTPSAWYAWFVVLVLCVAAIVSYIDRQVINLLVEPIKADFGINDTQIGLLQGFSFVLFYAAMAIPLARLADTKNRVTIISLGVVCWSLATFSCGLAGSFAVLFAARMFVGVGEATLTPAGYSLITDYFPRERVAVAVSLFTGSGFAGSGIAYAAGGSLVGYFSDMEQIILPLLGERSIWQATFIAVSVPSVLVLALMFFVREPPRRETGAGTAQVGVPFREVVTYFVSRGRLFGGVMFGLTMLAAAGYAVNLWTPTLFIRVHGYSPAEIGGIFGSMVFIGSTAGVFFGGAVASAWMKRGQHNAYLLVSLIAPLVALPFGIAFPLMENASVSLGLLTVVMVLSVVPFGAGTAVLPLITPPNMRAQSVAIYLLIANLLAFTCGPTSVGMLTDYVFRDPQLINYSMAIAPPLFTVVGCLLVGVALKPYGDVIRGDSP